MSDEDTLGEKRKCFVEAFLGCTVAFRQSAVLWRESFCCLTTSRSGSESRLTPEGTRKKETMHSTVLSLSFFHKRISLLGLGGPWWEAAAGRGGESHVGEMAC